MLRKFASIQHSEKYGYSYDSESWSSNAQVHVHFRMFETYGDGLCQHSGDWAITREWFADYMISLAAAMLQDAELANELVWMLSRRPAAADIAFAASVVFKPGEGMEQYEKKPRYYSMEEKKVTASDSKKYDKRYQRVTPAQTGRADAIYAMVIPEYPNDLERFQFAHTIYDWAMATEGQYMELTACFLGWTEDRDEARKIRDAFEAARNVAESYRLRAAVESDVERFRDWAARDKAAAAEKAAAA